MTAPLWQSISTEHSWVMVEEEEKNEEDIIVKEEEEEEEEEEERGHTTTMYMYTLHNKSPSKHHHQLHDPSLTSSLHPFLPASGPSSLPLWIFQPSIRREEGREGG